VRGDGGSPGVRGGIGVSACGTVDTRSAGPHGARAGGCALACDHSDAGECGDAGERGAPGSDGGASQLVCSGRGGGARATDARAAMCAGAGGMGAGGRRAHSGRAAGSKFAGAGAARSVSCFALAGTCVSGVANARGERGDAGSGGSGGGESQLVYSGRGGGARADDADMRAAAAGPRWRESHSGRAAGWTSALSTSFSATDDAYVSILPTCAAASARRRV
jgi:serine protease Do